MCTELNSIKIDSKILTGYGFTNISSLGLEMRFLFIFHFRANFGHISAIAGLGLGFRHDDNFITDLLMSATNP